ncbi:ion channel [Halobacillus salinus]|uniref:Two pore domain potassium channel family protein n=1 Tax=Halobacillus salinus TaxID=192814 RepID=A0A4Z0GYN3_9BACI|nr:ion channel [Halobacillus salinus]TGB02344.1 two pore domain potassium channel family protein [Halobacillus salinus]
MVTVLIMITVLLIASSLYYFFQNKTFQQSYFNVGLFVKLFMVMTVVLLGFSLVYYLLSLRGVVLVQSLSSMKAIEPTALNLLYFSSETILSVGYGDMLPVGPARFFAMIESMVGILLPTAYFARTFSEARKRE